MHEVDVPAPPGRPGIVGLLRMREQAHPDAPWLRFEDDVYTWSQALANVHRAANGLAEMGVEPGQRVALMLSNRPEFLWVHFGAELIGATSVTVNTAQRGEALWHILSDSESVAVICDAELLPAVRAKADRLPALRQIVAASPAGGSVGLGGATTLDHLLDQPDEEPPAPSEHERRPPPAITYTSGTTGPPKGVVSVGGPGPRSLNALGRVLGATGVHPGEVMYTSLPLFHGNAMGVTVVGSVLLDCQVALGRRFSASGHFDACRRHGAVEFNTLGGMIPMLLKTPERPDDAEHPVRVVLSAGCPPWAWEQFETRFGVKLVEWFGMVDAPGFLLNDAGRVGSMGRPVGDTEFAVVDDADQPLEPGQVGELVFRGPGGPPTEYHNDPEATARAYQGGWFHTGDLAERDTDGFFYYRGRKKESMRRRGENISAWEVESAVNTHPAVAESAAHGVPSDLGEDEVKVIVVLRPGERLDPEALLDHCRGRLAYYAVPRYVEIVDQLPKTGTQRPDYGALRRRGLTGGTWDREVANYRVGRE
ncbi:MAG TPA: AMP-binding protein [Acidimicrobiales bacterium]|nr:AMP-binding protein [Acidimicrobiales bacterium]